MSSKRFNLHYEDIKKTAIAFLVYVAPTLLAISGDIKVDPQFTILFSVVIDLLRRFVSDTAKK
jgi:hypothetical protein